MMNSRPEDLDAAEYYYWYANASDSYESAEKPTFSASGVILWLVITLIICCIGLVGNGCIIWLLGFQIKRNGFTIFILNLAIADFGHLISLFSFLLSLIFIRESANFQGGEIFNDLCIFFFCIMYLNENFLMTAISIDRCVAVLFPIWYHCSRPKHLSPAVCAFLWIFSFLLAGIMVSRELTKVLEYHNLYDLHFLVSAVICLPLITLSTVVLFFRVCLKLNQRNQGRVLLTILITFLCFLILAFPLTVLELIVRFSGPEIYNKVKYWDMCTILLSCLNSSINPVIYFLVGRGKGAQSKKSLKVIFQNAFKEGEAA